MSTVYQSAYVSLHVRKTNRAAISLYRDSLGFEVHDVEISYCESPERSCFPSSSATTRWEGRRDERGGEDARSIL